MQFLSQRPIKQIAIKGSAESNEDFTPTTYPPSSPPPPLPLDFENRAPLMNAFRKAGFAQWHANLSGRFIHTRREMLGQLISEHEDFRL